MGPQAVGIVGWASCLHWGKVGKSEKWGGWDGVRERGVAVATFRLGAPGGA